MPPCATFGSPRHGIRKATLHHGQSSRRIAQFGRRRSNLDCKDARHLDGHLHYSHGNWLGLTVRIHLRLGNTALVWNNVLGPRNDAHRGSYFLAPIQET